eukprot:scaffold22098_cov76-Cyclotella_meneghiniana.AAC.1
MGPGNAGFLSGHPFVIPDRAEDEKNLYKRPMRVRIAFLVACGILMVFCLLFVTMGLTNVDNTATTFSASLRQLGDLVGQAEVIAKKLEEDGLEILRTGLNRVELFSDEADNVISEWNFWGWQFKLLSAGLFILPSFLMMGVGLVMLDLDIKCYQRTLTYVLMPLFFLVVVATYVVCALILPASAALADTCIGGGEVHGGPDDTVLTIYRNLRGDDNSIVFLLGAYYTQQCNPIYYPFGEISQYLDLLDGAIDSTNTVIDTIQGNLDLLLDQCGRSYDSVVRLVKDMNISLRTLRSSADQTLSLVQCKNINQLYVNTIHEATCTYSVEALAWIFGSSLVISICGLIIVMLRSAYYPEEYLELSKHWNTSPTMTRSMSSPASRDSNDSNERQMPSHDLSPPNTPPMRHIRSVPRSPKYVTNPNEYTEAVEL